MIGPGGRKLGGSAEENHDDGSRKDGWVISLRVMVGLTIGTVPLSFGNHDLTH